MPACATHACHVITGHLYICMNPWCNMLICHTCKNECTPTPRKKYDKSLTCLLGPGLRHWYWAARYHLQAHGMDRKAFRTPLPALLAPLLQEHVYIKPALLAPSHDLGIIWLEVSTFSFIGQVSCCCCCCWATGYKDCKPRFTTWEYSETYRG